jgi:hypothetical protein
MEKWEYRTSSRNIRTQASASSYDAKENMGRIIGQCSSLIT